MASITRAFLSVGVLLSLVAFICCSSIGNTRIVGGHRAEVGQFPFLVSLHTEREWNRQVDSYCSGSILSKRFVLTSVGCESDKPIFVFVNALSAKDGQQYETKRFIKHPGYIPAENEFKPKPPSNNIALIEMATPIQFTDNVKPIELERTVMQGNELSIIAGYGYSRDVVNNFFLNYAYVNTLPQRICKSVYKKWYTIENNTLCAFAKPGTEICAHDFGGPLIRNNKLIGVASWHTGRNPDLFTRITDYLNWIEENTVA